MPQYQSYVGQPPMQAPAKPATPAWQLVGMGVVIAVAAMKGLEWLGGQKGRIQVPPHLSCGDGGERVHTPPTTNTARVKVGFSAEAAPRCTLSARLLCGAAHRRRP